MVIRLVDPGSPAERAGLKAGDVVAELNGRPVAEIGVEARLEALRTSPLAITVSRGHETLRLALALE